MFTWGQSFDTEPQAFNICLLNFYFKYKITVAKISSGLFRFLILKWFCILFKPKVKGLQAFVLHKPGSRGEMRLDIMATFHLPCSFCLLSSCLLPLNLSPGPGWSHTADFSGSSADTTHHLAPPLWVSQSSTASMMQSSEEEWMKLYKSPWSHLAIT